MNPPIGRLLFGLLAFSGCAREARVDGEIFTNVPVQGVSKVTGAAVYFLLPSEKDKFDKIVSEWREQVYRENREVWEALGVNSDLPLGTEQTKSYLEGKKRVITDSEGRFSILLKKGAEYWVIAGSRLPNARKWYFRYTPDGTKLVLSDANAL